MAEKTPVAIIGSGNIGTDLLYKLKRSATLERCLQKVKRYHAAGITHLMVMFDWGGMPQRTVFHSMKLFARYVMPHFRERGDSESPALQAQSA